MVFAAFMAAIAVVMVLMVIMMIAVSIRVEVQRSSGESLRCRIRRTLNAGIEPDPRVGQRHLRAHAHSAADQGVGFDSLEETGQRAVSASVRVYDLFRRYPAVLRIIKLKLRGMTEMLKDFSVFISYCDPH